MTKETDKQKIMEFVKEHSGLLVFFVTTFGTIAALVVKFLSIIYKIGRYKAIGIPLGFIDYSFSAKSIIPLIYVIFTVVVGMTIAVFCCSYYEHLKAYMKFDSSFHTMTQPKWKRILFKGLYVFIFFFSMTVINLPCGLFISMKSSSLIVYISIGFILSYTEWSMAEHIYNLIVDIKKPKRNWEFHPYKKGDTLKELTKEEIEEIDKEYMLHKPLASFNLIKTFVIFMLLIVCAVSIIFTVGQGSIKGDYSYQVIKTDDGTFVVLDEYNGKYIVSPAEIEEDDYLYLRINNSKQKLMDIADVEYEKVVFNEVEYLTNYTKKQ